MNNRCFYADKSPGYIMIFVMLLLSGLIFFIVSMSVKIYVSRQMASTMQQNHMLKKVVSTSIAIIRSMLKGSSRKEGEKQSDGDSGEGQSKEKKIQEEAIKTFKSLWTNMYDWKQYTVTEENEGVDGKISLYIMVEDGKIPVSEFIKNIQNGIKEKKQEQTHDESNEASDSTGDEEQEEKAKNENDNETVQEGNEKDQKIENNELYKEMSSLFELLGKKSSAFKKLNKKAQQESAGKEKNPFFDKVLKRWIKQKKGENPLSLWNLVNSVSEKDQVDKDVISYGFNKETREYEVGDLISPYANNWSSLYISPAILEGSGVKDFQLTPEMRKNIIEVGEKLIKENKINQPIEQLWEELYTKTTKVPFVKEMKESKILKTLLLPSLFPESVSALILAEVQSTLIKILVVFEKMTSFDNTNNNQYAIKQMFIL